MIGNKPFAQLANQPNWTTGLLLVSKVKSGVQVASSTQRFINLEEYAIKSRSFFS